MLSLLDASAIRRWCGAAAAGLSERRAEIDALNVYPIPDGDTGTNLDLTLRSAAEALESDAFADGSTGAGAVLAAMAQGAVLGARGNSGVIVSQILRGMADAFGDVASADGAQLAAALEAACESAYAAVAKPVEGTILSVLRCAAEESRRTCDRPGASLADIVAAAADGATAALARTPGQLDVLAAAGVVDAGGQGLVVMLDALAATVRCREAPTRATSVDTGPLSPTQTQGAEAGPAAPEYEVQYLLRSDEPSVARLKKALGELGDSLAVVGTGDGVFNVHVHVNDVGAAIEAGIEAGRPHRISVVRFANQFPGKLPVKHPVKLPDSHSDEVRNQVPGKLPDQIPDHVEHRPADHPVGHPAGHTESSRIGTAMVAVAPGEELGDLFRSEGVAVVEGGLGDNPSTAEVLAGILAVGAARVILLPNAAAVRAVAELAAEQAREQGIEVAVVPTKSPLQGLAAVAVHDEDRRFEDDVIALAEAAAATRFAEVTLAVRESITYAGRCAAGDVLGLIDGEVVRIGSDVSEVAIDLVNRLIAAGGELVTVVSGAGAGAAQAAAVLERHVRAAHPLVDISMFSGGQPHFPLLIGVE